VVLLAEAEAEAAELGRALGAQELERLAPELAEEAEELLGLAEAAELPEPAPEPLASLEAEEQPLALWLLLTLAEALAGREALCAAALEALAQSELAPLELALLLAQGEAEAEPELLLLPAAPEELGSAPEAEAPALQLPEALEDCAAD
jgi:hypothetical protein